MKLDMFQRDAIWVALHKMLKESRAREDVGCGKVPLYSDGDIVAEAMTQIDRIIGNQTFILRR